jgi:DNA-binding response OmpR family regulator
VKKRILILDDEIDFTFIMKRLLELTGKYEVRTTVMPGTFMDVARAYKPDLILLDCMMPNLDGGEIAAKLEADKELKETPFMFLTATIDQVETRPSRCYAGERKYLPKTLDWNEMFKHFDEEIAKGGSAGPAAAGQVKA